jgi:EmrB/QacA subfamily drug resistance transporter
MGNVTTTSYSDKPATGPTPPPAEPRTDAPLDRAVWTVAGVALLGPLMSVLDSTVVNVSLATLSSQLGAPLTTIQWVTSGYLLALALMLPISGWVVDRVGAKHVYIGCFTAFTAASLLCGAATTATGLILCRVLQGMAGGVLAPMAQMMVARIAGRHVARVMSVIVMPILIGPILGPVLAGAILQHASWRWIFFINLPIGVLATTLAIWLLPRDAHEAGRRPLDVTGLLLLSPGLVLMLHSLETLGAGGAGTRWSVIELALAGALLVAFVRHAIRRGRDALIDVQLFRRKTLSAAACTQFLSNATAYGGQMLIPLYLLMERGVSPSQAGLLLAPGGLGALCSYPFVGRLTERFGARAVSLTGAVIALLATTPLALFGGVSLPMAAFAVVLFLRGVGGSGIGIPSIAAAYTSIPRAMIPVATTALNIVQRIGGPVATTVLAIFLHARIAHISHAFVATFWLLVAIHAVTVVATLRLPGSAGLSAGESQPQPR